MPDEETQASAPAAPGNGVQLGIGTLIIIALIVTMCSGGGEIKKLQSDNVVLKQQVTEINQKLDRLLSKDSPAPAPSSTP